MTPTHPVQDGILEIRDATPNDVSRMAHISVESFRNSEIFRFCRPLHHLHPEDSVASFAGLYQAQLADA